MVLNNPQAKDNSSYNIRSRRSLVTLTPLVDVVFVLLVFFMLVSSFSDRGVIGIMTPAAAKQASEAGARAVLIRVAEDGSLNFSGVPMSAVQLAQEVAGRTVGDSTLSYLVQPEPGVTVQQVVSVVDLLKSSGAKNVSLTRKPPRP